MLWHRLFRLHFTLFGSLLSPFSCCVNDGNSFYFRWCIFVLLYLSIYLCCFFLDINDGNKGAQWRKGKKKTNAQNDRWRKTHLTPYIRIFIAHCAIINVILLISNHLLLPCHINRYRLFIRSNTFKSIYFVVAFFYSSSLASPLHHYIRWDFFGSSEHSF